MDEMNALNIPLEELTEEEDERMLELIMKVVQLTAKSPMDVVGKKKNETSEKHLNLILGVFCF